MAKITSNEPTPLSTESLLAMGYSEVDAEFILALENGEITGDQIAEA